MPDSCIWGAGRPGWMSIMKNKMKTHKGLKKRIRITASGKVRIRKAGAGHLLSGKTGNRRRNLRQAKILVGKLAKNIKDVISKA